MRYRRYPPKQGPLDHLLLGLVVVGLVLIAWWLL